jgi:hypothetical protein
MTAVVRHREANKRMPLPTRGGATLTYTAYFVAACGRRGCAPRRRLNSRLHGGGHRADIGRLHVGVAGGAAGRVWSCR